MAMQEIPLCRRFNLIGLQSVVSRAAESAADPAARRSSRFTLCTIWTRMKLGEQLGLQGRQRQLIPHRGGGLRSSAHDSAFRRPRPGPRCRERPKAIIGFHSDDGRKLRPRISAKVRRRNNSSVSRREDAQQHKIVDRNWSARTTRLCVPLSRMHMVGDNGSRRFYLNGYVESLRSAQSRFSLSTIASLRRGRSRQKKKSTKWSTSN